jgi:hypothetical protein
MTMLARMWRKGNPLVRMEISTAITVNSLEVPQKLKIELQYDPSILLLGIYLKIPVKDSSVLPCSVQHYSQ